MSAVWYIAFALLTALSLLNAALLIAAMREIGVLHQRVRPTGPGTQEGPEPGWELPIVDFALASTEAGSYPFSAPVTVLAYVTPGCALCEALPGIVSSFTRHIPAEAGIHAVLATDSPLEAARRYAKELAADVPLFQCDGLARAWSLPGSPYVVAAEVISSEYIRVRGSGVVNTLEQLEDLVGMALVPPPVDDDAAGLEEVHAGGGESGSAGAGAADGVPVITVIGGANRAAPTID